jgi:hypothetical protein
MGRDSARNFTRERIAHLAARMMAEDGIEDYGLAKRKAARQAGAADTRQLPDNEEIEAALRTYRELYQQRHPAQLRELRELALAVMAEFPQFDPHLTGSVLHGNAGKFADIHLQLFAESNKAVEFALLDRGIRYQTAAVHLYAGEMPLDAAVLSFERDAVTIHLTLLSPRERRLSIKTGRGGRAIERANRQAVEALLVLTDAMISAAGAARSPR